MPIPQSTEVPTQSTSWADQMEDLDASKITPDNLPEPVTKIDGDTKTVVSYKLQEDGKIKKITTVYKIERHRVPKAVARRKKLAKFGDASRDNPDGPDRATTQIADDVFLTLTTNKETLEQQDDDPLKKLQQQAKGMVTCRICKGDHWTSRCPYKDTLGATTIKELEDQETASKPAPPAPTLSLGSERGGGGGGKYIPPNQRGDSKRGERGGDSMSQSRVQDDMTTVRVTNLSEDAQEGDLRDLFSHFGPLKRIFLAKNKITQQSKGFAFVSYVNREDAQKAITNLHGFGYDHLILSVEWAKPSKPHGQ